MLPIDPGDQGSSPPGGRPPVPPEGALDGEKRDYIERAVSPARPFTDVRPLSDILPAQAMAHGGTIIRPGAVAWGGLRDARDTVDFSCEAVERRLAATAADPGQLPGLLAELATTRLWVPLPVRHRPFTDGTAVRLPLVGHEGTDFVPCFTSVQRLTAWSDAAPDAPRPAAPGELKFAETGRRWQRAGDARVVPHIVVPAAGLARRLPTGLGLAVNPESGPGLPLYPESVSYLARLADPTAVADGPFRIGHPPTEPEALLRETRAGLRALPQVRQASRAWLTVPGQGEGLVISVELDDPASAAAREAVADALERAAAAVPLRVPFPIDVTFPGEVFPGEAFPCEPAADPIADWMARNTRPFYTRP